MSSLRSDQLPIVGAGPRPFLLHHPDVPDRPVASAPGPAGFVLHPAASRRHLATSTAARPRSTPRQLSSYTAPSLPLDPTPMPAWPAARADDLSSRPADRSPRVIDTAPEPPRRMTLGSQAPELPSLWPADKPEQQQ